METASSSALTPRIVQVTARAVRFGASSDFDSSVTQFPTARLTRLFRSPLLAARALGARTCERMLESEARRLTPGSHAKFRDNSHSWFASNIGLLRAIPADGVGSAAHFWPCRSRLRGAVSHSKRYRHLMWPRFLMTMTT